MSSELVTRFISISELISQQHLPCVSNITWSTTQQKEWVKGAELSLPGHQALPRVNLLLIGCLQEGRGGEWRLTDASGSVRCEVSVMTSSFMIGPLMLDLSDCLPVTLVPVSLSSVAESSCLPSSLELHPPQCSGAGTGRGWRSCGADWFSCPALSCS